MAEDNNESIGMPTKTTVSPENENSTVASYAALYATLNLSPLSGNNENGPVENKTTRATTTTTTDASRPMYWQEDDWTDVDFASAEGLLDESRSRCAIPSSKRKEQYEKDAGKNWDRFYQSHQTNFFNDRHYLQKDFPNEFGQDEQTRDDKKCLMEIGCGVGNNILPLLDRYRSWEMWGYDISSVAVQLMQNEPRFVAAKDRVHAGVWDIASTAPPTPVVGVADITTLVFCLSAIAPDKMQQAAIHVATTLKQGGTLVFRDYGRYDAAQMKLGTSRSKQISDNFYVKSDGTRCYYFTTDDLHRLFVENAGMKVLELRYLRRVYQNRAQNQQRRRVWVQARFEKV